LIDDLLAELPTLEESFEGAPVERGVARTRGESRDRRLLPGCQDRLEAAPLSIHHASPIRYAQRVTPFRLGTPDGPTIGRLYPGTAVHLLYDDGTFAEVKVPWRDYHARTVTAFVSSESLGPDPGDAPEHDDTPAHGLAPRGFGSRFILGLYASALEVRSAKPFAHSNCSPFAVVESTSWHGDLPPRATRITQVVDGVAIEAWSEAVPRLDGRALCGARAVVEEDGALVAYHGTGERSAVEKVPDGFSIATPPPNVLGEMFQEGAPVYWLAPDRAKLRCLGWLWESGSRRLRSIATEGVAAPWHWYYEARYEPSYTRLGIIASLSLWGPRSIHPDGRDGPEQWQSGNTYIVISANDDEICLLENLRNASIRAWHPGSAQRWYRSAEACEDARVRGVLLATMQNRGKLGSSTFGRASA
jgi:hypothetical protein